MTEQKLKFEFLSTSVDQTIRLGKAIGTSAQGGEVIALIGELGTGKTHLIKGIAQGLTAGEVDANTNERVTSPTFTLMQEYAGRLTLYHIDAYRLEDARQLEALGFDELCEAGGVIVVEWADRVWPLVADYDPISIYLEYASGEQERKIRIENISSEMKEQLKQIGEEP
jgi:tRNA threonylcarbamoyladenosine biosynthesis protein TsaE